MLLLYHFLSYKRYQPAPLNLFNLKKKAQESLQEYIRRSTQASLEMPSAMAKILMSAFGQRLCKGDLFHSLANKPLRDYDELLIFAEKYIIMEEAQKACLKKRGS